MKHNQTGTTLVELMVAAALVGVIALGLLGAFGSVGKSVQFSKDRSLAANLAQEKMQILKQQSFNRIMITTTPASIPGFTPAIDYDPGYYAPENILEGGKQFTRYTFVEVVGENSGALDYLPTGTADTGMKSITVTVTWRQGQDVRKYQMKNIAGNINAIVNNVIIKGVVTINATSTGIQGALITMAENVGYQDYTNATGNYLLNLLPGTYTMNVIARGYFPAYTTVSIAPTNSLTQNFSLIPMSSGTIRGTAWINDHLVISNVVGSTQNAAGFCTEFVELFNPSTYTWTIASSPTTPLIDLKYQRYGEFSPTTITMVYSSFTVAAGGYYLFANSPTVKVAGVLRTADAVYSPTNTGYPDLIYTGGGGACSNAGADSTGLGISYTSSGAWLDKLGWSNTLGVTHAPPLVEGNPILLNNMPMREGEEFTRKSSTAGVIIGIGRAYDSGNNNLDIAGSYLAAYPPRNTSNIEPVVAGAPAFSAYVTATDGLSAVAQATTQGISPNPPYAEFQLTSVATGTWTVLVSSGSYLQEISSVTVTANTTTRILNSNTVPAWPAAGHNAVILSSVAVYGYIAGVVGNAGGVPIAPSITMSAFNYSVPANSINGTFLLPVPPGTYDVMANALNPVNNLYVFQSSSNVVATLGRVTSDVDFYLSQGGRVRGFSSRDGINPLPGIVFTAVDAGGTTRDQEVSGSDGRFLLVNLSTGTYTIAGTLDTGDVSVPTTASANVTVAATIDVGTFTITGTFGSIRGSVTETGRPIKTGVMIVCSTMTLPTGPQTLSVNTLASASYYSTNSYEDGTYILDVRGSTSTTYRLYAYYSKFVGAATMPTISSVTVSGVAVLAGQSTTGVDFGF